MIVTLTGLACRLVAQAPQRPAAEAAEQAHAELWRRFVDRHGILLDFTALDGTVELPTPEECRAGQPNALGWWSPTENGAMFNGLYLDAAVNRWRHTRTADDAAKVRRLVAGLVLLASLSEVPGFVGRGVSTDGRSHYPLGSDDQTLPWFYGLWRYLDSGLATADERARLVPKLVEVAEALQALGWAMPAEPPFGRRGSFAGFDHGQPARLLFVLKLLAWATGDARWDEGYQAALHERGGPEGRSRLEACARGMVFWYAPTHNWTSCCEVAALRGLWELEREPAAKAAYAHGLQASADLAARSLELADRFDPADAQTFSPDWRTPMLPLWRPQTTAQQAEAVAHEQLRAFLRHFPRRGVETAFVREPTAAAWIVTLTPDESVLAARRAAVERVIARYDYARLHYSTFFWAESAWWRLTAPPVLR